VIGDRKFAYDLWGDTVNLASRLQELGEPDQVLVAESTVAELADGYEFEPARLMEVRGKGRTPVRVLLGRKASVPVRVPSS
jgi:guanylate cyclase